MTFSFEDELNKVNAALGIGRRGQVEGAPLAADEIPRSLLRQCYQCGRTEDITGHGRYARCPLCYADERREAESDVETPDNHGRAA